MLYAVFHATRNTRLYDFFQVTHEILAYTIFFQVTHEIPPIRFVPRNRRNTRLYAVFLATHEILLYTIFSKPHTKYSSMRFFLQTTHEILSYTAHEMAIRRFPCNTRNTRNTRLYDFLNFFFFFPAARKPQEMTRLYAVSPSNRLTRVQYLPTNDAGTRKGR